MGNRSGLQTLVKYILVLVLGIGAAEWLCYADTSDSSCPKGEVKTDEGCIKNPVLLRKVQPEYPREARRARQEGHVTLQARVMEDGTVSDVEVKKCTNPGHGFEDAAMDALKKWRYEAGTLNGKPTPIYFTVTIDFMLQ
jgi:TonB family protein